MQAERPYELRACVRAAGLWTRVYGRWRATRAGQDLLHCVDVGTSVQQEPRDLDVAVFRSYVEARDPVLGERQV
jgi:hypothetical protein